MATLAFDTFWRDHGAKAGLKGLSKEAREAAKAQEEFKRRAVVAGAAVGAVLFKVGRDSINVASDTSESFSKVGVVFGKSAGVVTRYAETSAKAMGISKAAYLDAAGTLGNLFVALKLPQSEAAKMSTKMVGLAADLASFNNADPTEVLEALRAGLVGETEPLRRFGININDAALREKALSMGLVKTTKDVLPASVKAQASYALILEQTSTAQGDFARTSGGLANQQRILKAEFSDLEGELGAKLLPAAVKTAHALVGLVDFLDEHGKGVAIAAGAFAAVAGSVIAVNKAAAGFKATAEAWDHVTTAVQSFTKEGGKGRASLGSLASFMTGPWGGAMLVGGAALAVWAKHQADAKARVDDLRDSLDEQTGAVTRNSRELAYQNLVERNAVRDAKLLGVSLSDLTEAALGNADAQVRVTAAIEAAKTTYQGAGRGAEAYGSAIDNVEQSLGVQNRELVKARGELDDARAAGVVAADATDDLTTSVKTNTKAVEDNTTKLDKRDGILKKRDAERNFEQAIDDVSAALKENGRTLDNGTEKGRRNNEALDRLAEAADDYKKAIREAGGDTSEANEIQRVAYRRLVDAARAMGMGKEAAKRYARSVLDIPDKKTTKIDADKRAADAALNSFERHLARLHGKTVVVGAKLSFPSDWAQYRAGERKATGGQIGDGTGTVDEVPILAMRGEHMWTTRETQAVGGHAAMKRLRNAALAGELKGYAAGGAIGASSSPAYARAGVQALESNLEYLAVKFGKDLQSQLGGIGGGALGGLGWARQWAAVHRAFPWATLHSSYRNGAVTASGNRSYHALGRAIDVSPSMDIFRWIARNYGGRTKELIFSTAGTDQIKDGRKHWYGEPVRGMHWNHVHWAYDEGGLASGRGWMPKGTSAPERVLSPRQTASFENLVRVLDRGGAGGAVTVNVSFPNYIGNRSELKTTLRDWAQTGELDRLIRRR